MEQASASKNRGVNDTGEYQLRRYQGQPVELKVGVSYVSLANARQNLEAETGGLDFEGVRDAARRAWDSRLSAVQLKPTPKSKQSFTLPFTDDHAHEFHRRQRPVP